MVKRTLHLTEWEPKPLKLGSGDLAALLALGNSVEARALGERGTYSVVAKNVAGAVRVGDLELLIEPKFGIQRTLHMVAVAGNVPELGAIVGLQPYAGITEVVAVAYLNALRTAVRRGLLLDYAHFEDEVVAFRGRLLPGAQLRRRFGLPIPVSVSFDDYTVDNARNRILKAALRRLLQVRYSDPAVRSRVVEALAAFDAVTDVEFPRAVYPHLAETRLTAQYGIPLRFAKTILSGWTPELFPGDSPLSGLLFRMDRVFEDFLFVVLRNSLLERLPTGVRWHHGKSLRLDEGHLIKLKPDFSIWGRNRCLFVGDAKYRPTDVGEGDDLYQLLTYCIAANLSEGLLIYAASSSEIIHQVVYQGPRLRVMSVALDRGLEVMTDECDRVAEAILEMASVVV